MVHELAHGVVLPLCPPQCSGDTGLDLPFPVPREPWSHLIACQSHRCLSPGLGNQSFQEWGSAKFGKLCDLYRPLQPWPSQSLWGHKEQKRSPGGYQTQVLKPMVFLSRHLVIMVPFTDEKAQEHSWPHSRSKRITLVCPILVDQMPFHACQISKIKQDTQLIWNFNHK